MKLPPFSVIEALELSVIVPPCTVSETPLAAMLTAVSNVTEVEPLRTTFDVALSIVAAEMTTSPVDVVADASVGVPLPVVSTSIVAGSSSQVPIWPCGANVSTVAPVATPSWWPDVSTQPPLPPCGPPVARIVPLNTVVPSDHTDTVPPLPLPVALASMRAPVSTVTLCALASAGSAPCGPPPISTVPPPAGPFARTLATGARSTLLPVTLTVPPVPVGAGPPMAVEVAGADALSVPETLTAPPGPPERVIDPFCPDTEFAVTTPDRLTASRIAVATVAALSSTVPPAAAILPELLTSAWPSAVVAPVGTATCRNPPPFRSSVAASPEPRPTRPSGTEIVPEFAVVPPMSPTNPPGPAVIVPAFPTGADAPFPVKLRFPPIKS